MKLPFYESGSLTLHYSEPSYIAPLSTGEAVLLRTMHPLALLHGLLGVDWREVSFLLAGCRSVFSWNSFQLILLPHSRVSAKLQEYGEVPEKSVVGVP